MGVTIRERSDKRDGIWWVFVSHMNRRTSFKVGDYDAALDVAHELQVMLAIDRAVHNLRLQRRIKLDKKLKGEAMDLRSRISRLLKRLDKALRHNETDRAGRGVRHRRRK